MIGLNLLLYFYSKDDLVARSAVGKPGHPCSTVENSSDKTEDDNVISFLTHSLCCSVYAK